MGSIPQGDLPLRPIVMVVGTVVVNGTLLCVFLLAVRFNKVASLRQHRSDNGDLSSRYQLGENLRTTIAIGTVY